MANRDFDVILYGASGFTGSQTVQYFARHAPPGLRWAIAGRNSSKLEALHADVPIFVADSADQPAIDAIVSRTRVLLTTAGPFALYGNCIVDACVRHRTHYVDITGETVWVRELIDRYHNQAASDGTRIIPFCGFDCVPCDLGAHWIANKLGPKTVEIKAFFQAKSGSPNGGTMASAFHSWESGDNYKMRAPFLLSPDTARDLRPVERDPEGAHFDSDIQAWTAPWIMGVIDTRVVRRSLALLGRDIAYQEYMKLDSHVAASLVAGFSAFSQKALNLAPFRRLLRLVRPGSGPSEKKMNEGFFRCDFFARAEDGTTAQASMFGQGDPANRITVKCVCESALALACDEDQLPARAGILTPSTGIGDILIARLDRQGIKIG